MKRWITIPVDESAARRLAGELVCPAALGRVLAARGLTDAEAAGHFLQPRLSDLSDPFELPAMADAVRALWAAVDRGAPISVYGDYDVDGITATALMTQSLRGLGAKVTPFLPSRMEDGYGLTVDTVGRCIEEQRPGFIVTVDCGTNSTSAVEHARAQGVEMVITDHHHSSGAPAPALAVVNPRLASGAQPWSDLAGVGVAFKLAYAMVKQGRLDGRSVALSLDLRRFFDLVALGTVADCVPLRGENRIFVRHGLPKLDAPGSPGLRALRQIAGVRGETDTYHVGFLFGPRLNAAGRLGTAEAALELLLTESEARAQTLARELDGANRERQAIEKQLFAEARALIQARFAPELDSGIVVAGDGWHPGVIGIVASRLVSFYTRPTVVIALDGAGGGRGSCRSVEGLNMVECLTDCGDVLKRYGGHAMAAGLELEAGRVDEFRHRFIEAVNRRMKIGDMIASLRIDTWIELGAADEGLYEGVRTMRPCGQGNPEPVWAVRGVRLVAPRRVGDKHVKFTVEQAGAKRDAIAFGMGDRELPAGPADVAFELKRDTWNGRDALQLQIRDVRPSE